MANWVKNLLTIEDEKIKESRSRKGTHACKYLSSLLDEKIEIELAQISDEEYKSFMARMGSDVEGTTDSEIAVSNQEVMADMITYAITDQDILSQEMMDKFKATDTIILMKKIFPGSELFEVFAEVSQLCEYELPPEKVEEKKTKSGN